MASRDCWAFFEGLMLVVPYFFGLLGRVVIDSKLGTLNGDTGEGGILMVRSAFFCFTSASR
jgi:hypothetical protein